MSEIKKDWKAIADKETPQVTDQPKEKLTDQQAEKLEESGAAKIEHAEYNELATKLTEAEQLANEYLNKFLRAQAEMHNLMKRCEQDVAKAHKYALDKFAFDLLPVIDCLERSLTIDIGANLENVAAKELLKNMHIGIEMTLKLFLETLEKFGIKQINPLNEIFNPDLHTAMTVQENNSVPPNTVLQVMQKGYLLNDRLLRPALVVVAKS